MSWSIRQKYGLILYILQIQNEGKILDLVSNHEWVLIQVTSPRRR